MKKILLYSKNIERDSFLYNAAGGLIYALQSVLLLMVINRMLGIEASGVFTIAFAVANLFLNIGKYGMRNYQVTDVRKKYSFEQYLRSRYMTTLLMVTAAAVYIFYRGNTLHYSADKSWIIFLMCLWKAVDSMEDIYYGQYQQEGRLDVAGKCMTYRMIFTIICYSVCIACFRNLLAATAVTMILSAAVTWRMIRITCPEVLRDRKAGESRLYLELLKDTFPLFLSSFLTFYQINAPKYAIDALMNSADQANFGFLSMPVFVVGLLCQFIYMPILKKLAETFSQGKYKEYIGEVVKQILYIAILTVIVIAGAYICGIPVLSVLYKADLSRYRAQLCILMLGGGLLAYCTFMMTVLTIQRLQKLIIAGYAGTSVFELLAVSRMVRRSGLYGASWIFTTAMAVLGVYLSVVFAAAMIRAAGEKEKK